MLGAASAATASAEVAHASLSQRVENDRIRYDLLGCLRVVDLSASSRVALFAGSLTPNGILVRERQHRVVKL
jgi:hypothetical protein